MFYHNSRMRWVHCDNFTGWQPKRWQGIEKLKREKFWVDDSLESTGDAPKEFIRCYRYQAGFRRKRKAKWPLYIAKTGHKWYPNESITEHLITRIGQCFGFQTAETSLALITGQLRLLSKHFHSREEELVHGAEIYYGYMDDRAFIDQIEHEQKARSFFTVQFTQQALETMFPMDYAHLFDKFLEMILFDALIGNNDRHYYNWGIIKGLEQGKKLRFAPIYDTARGLLWNVREEKVVNLCRNKDLWRQFRSKYLNDSKPKIGWDGRDDLNHFDLLKHVVNQNPSSMHWAKFLKEDNLISAFSVIDTEFGNLFSSGRKSLIKDLLHERFKTIIYITLK